MLTFAKDIRHWEGLSHYAGAHLSQKLPTLGGRHSLPRCLPLQRTSNSLSRAPVTVPVTTPDHDFTFWVGTSHNPGAHLSTWDLTLSDLLSIHSPGSYSSQVVITLSEPHSSQGFHILSWPHSLPRYPPKPRTSHSEYAPPTDRWSCQGITVDITTDFIILLKLLVSHIPLSFLFVSFVYYHV